MSRKVRDIGAARDEATSIGTASSQVCVEAEIVEHDVRLSPKACGDSHADDSEELMSTGCILSDYIDRALAEATYDKLDDGSFSGRIPPCKGVVASGVSLVECQHLLRSILEDWLLLGLKLGHTIPVLSAST